jgi:hypothetical protein
MMYKNGSESNKYYMHKNDINNINYFPMKFQRI